METRVNAAIMSFRTALLTGLLFSGSGLLFHGSLQAQQQTTPPAAQTDDAGPQQDNNGVILKKKKPGADEPPPPAPDEEKVKNPKGLENYSIRVDVPVVTVDVSVQLQKSGQFVPGLKGGNFRVTEDGTEQRVTDVRMQQKPITAVLLLEFAANSWAFIQDMQQASYVFFKQLKPEDYIAIITYDLRTRILTDFTRDKAITADALRSLTIPGFSDTNEFDALYETHGPADPHRGSEIHHPDLERPRHFFKDQPRPDATRRSEV